MKTRKLRDFFPILLTIAGLGLAFGYVTYLKRPWQDGELKYFTQLPPELFRLPMFMFGNAPAFFWTLLLALAGLGLSFLILEKAERSRAMPI